MHTSGQARSPRQFAGIVSAFVGWACPPNYTEPFATKPRHAVGPLELHQKVRTTAATVCDDFARQKVRPLPDGEGVVQEKLVA